MNYNKKIDDTTVRLGEVRFSYVSVFERRRTDDGTQGKYGVCVVWPKSDKALTKMVEDAIAAAKEKGKSMWGGKIPANCKNPIHDGDIEREDDPVFQNCWYFNANTDKAPGIKVLENGKRRDALDSDDFYSGCYGAVTIWFHAYENSGNKGISAGLNNVIKTRDGEVLSGRRSADDDFGDIGEEDDDDVLG